MAARSREALEGEVIGFSTFQPGSG